MADVIRENSAFVVVAFRFSRLDFDHLVAGYPSRGRALGALRVLVQDALAVASTEVCAGSRAEGARTAHTSDG